MGQDYGSASHERDSQAARYSGAALGAADGAALRRAGLSSIRSCRVTRAAAAPRS